MCGRGAIDYDWQTLWHWMSLSGQPPAGGIRALNVAPSRMRHGQIEWSRLPVVRRIEGRRCVDPLAWPLVPAWLHGRLPEFSTANCRSEPDQDFQHTVRSKPAYRAAWKAGRRCLVPMSWFYEWDKRPKAHGRPSQPWRVEPAAGSLLVMAGLWERSKPADGEAIESFTIITTGPNRLLARIGHDRSPALLEPPQFETWLAGEPAEAAALLKPPPDGLLAAHKVSARVNNPEYQGDDLAPA